METGLTMATIDHLNPPTGHMADNVVGFARSVPVPSSMP
jgi:hypothetical protein